MFYRNLVVVMAALPVSSLLVTRLNTPSWLKA